MSKERYECEHNWIIDNNKRKTEENIIVYDEECNTLDDICELLNRQDKTIADLEAKLAELREQVTICDEENSKTFMKSVNAWRENAELKQQLAEKDKEIETLKHYNDRLAQGIYHSYGEHFISKVKQDKISFCIEKLQEAKRLLEEKYTYDVGESDFAVIYEDAIDEIIDNQIKQLKEMK